MNTPWGQSQDEREVAPGIIEVSTARHGGMHLSPERRKAMPAALRAFETCAGGPWYEEDLDAGIVVLAFPDDFSGHQVRNCVRMAQRGTWERHYAAWLALGADERNALCARADAWEEENAGKWETGSMSTGGKGWHVYFTQVGSGAEAWRAMDYPTGPLYDALPGEAVTRDD